MATSPTQEEMHQALIERLNTERDCLARILREIIATDGPLSAWTRISLTGLLDGMDAPSTFREHLRESA